jgi:hypothetical protein
VIPVSSADGDSRPEFVVSWRDRWVGVFVSLGLFRGWHGRIEVLAAVEAAVAEQVPVLVPSQRAGER